jgi:hypothetical protein
MKPFIKCVMIAAVFGLFNSGVIGQEATTPKIGSITTLPSEPILTGTCSSSYAGYLEKAGRTILRDNEVGHVVSKAIKHGYIVTIYPHTKRGIFVNFECPVNPKAQ